MAREWKQEHTARGWGWSKGATKVLCVEDGDRPWFASRNLMMLANKRRHVRRFTTAERAMKAADKASRFEFWA